jgi:Zn-dependent protease with chaperone function
MLIAAYGCKALLQSDSHWTERARYYIACRSALLLAAMLTAAYAGIFAYIATGPLQTLSFYQLAVLCVLCIYALYLESSFRLERAARGPETRRWRSLKNHLATLLVLRPILPITLLMIFIMPAELGIDFYVVLTCFTLLLLWSALGGAFRLAAMLGIVESAPPRLQDIVDREANKIGRPDVRAKLVHLQVANALAFQLQNTVAFTGTAMRVLDDEEVAAICHHELGHLGEKRGVIVTRLLPLLFFFVLGCAKPIVHNLGWIAFATLVILSFLALMQGLKTIRRMEEHADEDAHEQDEGSYASALEKLYEQNLVPAVLRQKTTHPDLYDRMLAAGATPQYSRPEPPPQRRGRCLAMILVAMTFALGQVFTADYFDRHGWESDTKARLALATSGGSPLTLSALARHRAEEDPLAAVALLRAVMSLRGDWPAIPARIAILLAGEDGQSQRAREFLKAAKQQHEEYEHPDDHVQSLILQAEQKLAGIENGVTYLDLNGESDRQVVVDREPGQYLGHPTTVLFEDGKTMLAVYPKGHGRGAIIMKRSDDAGMSWSDRLPVPSSWASSKETPTIHRVYREDGSRRLLLFSGLYPIRLASSDDDGESWSELAPIGDFGGIVAMASVEEIGPGEYMALFHDDGRFLRGGGERGKFRVFKLVSRDAGESWSEPVVIAEHAQAHLCEPGLIRSPDGEQLAVLLRENSRKFNSFVIFSEDGGETWSEPRELPATLTGDRHVGKYAPDGRLLVSFRDQPGPNESPTRGDWVAWIGRYEDLVEKRAGQYRVRLKDNLVRADCAYPGVESLPDGTFVLTTYGHWEEDEEPYILSIRLTLQEIDQKAAALR